MTKEMIEKAKKARSADELMAFANAAGIELEKSKAEELFARFSKSDEISDDDLCSVAGGASLAMYPGFDSKNAADELANAQGGECDPNKKVVAEFNKI